MRKNGVLYYILGDHLGSTSIVTDATGNVVSQTRYKAWGEVRHQSGVTPTEYGFTGQYSHAADFGLLFYNARWYDVSLGRFAQADTIVPPGVQGLDRYAYVNNSPMNYVDPSGHEPGACQDSALVNGSWVCNPTLSQVYGINTEGLDETQEQNAVDAAVNFGTYFYQNYGAQYGFTSPQDAFKKLTAGNVTIVLDPSRNNCETVMYTITCSAAAMMMKTFVHEFVHVMDNHYSVRSTNDEHCANTTGYGCLASNYFPSEYFADPQYAYMPYFYNDTRSISHPNTPGHGEYNTAEAYANYMENVILSGIDPANNGFKNNDFSNNLHTWRETGYGNIYQTLKVFGP